MLRPAGFLRYARRADASPIALQCGLCIMRRSFGPGRPRRRSLPTFTRGFTQDGLAYLNAQPRRRQEQPASRPAAIDAAPGRHGRRVLLPADSSPEKRAKEHRTMIAALEVGAEIVTNGGVLGKVVELSDQFVTVEIAPGVNVKVQRHAIAQILPKGTLKSA